MKNNSGSSHVSHVNLSSISTVLSLTSLLVLSKLYLQTRLPDKWSSYLTFSKGLWRNSDRHGPCFIYLGARVRSPITISMFLSGVLLLPRPLLQNNFCFLFFFSNSQNTQLYFCVQVKIKHSQPFLNTTLQPGLQDQRPPMLGGRFVGVVCLLRPKFILSKASRRLYFRGTLCKIFDSFFSSFYFNFCILVPFLKL